MWNNFIWKVMNFIIPINNFTVNRNILIVSLNREEFSFFFLFVFNNFSGLKDAIMVAVMENEKLKEKKEHFQDIHTEKGLISFDYSSEQI